MSNRLEKLEDYEIWMKRPMDVRSVGKMLKRAKTSYHIRFDGDDEDTILSRQEFPQLEKIRTRQRFEAIVTRQKRDWGVLAISEVKVKTYIPKIVLERIGRRLWKNMKVSVVKNG